MWDQGPVVSETEMERTERNYSYPGSDINARIISRLQHKMSQYVPRLVEIHIKETSPSQLAEHQVIWWLCHPASKISQNSRNRKQPHSCSIKSQNEKTRAPTSNKVGESNSSRVLVSIPKHFTQWVYTHYEDVHHLHIRSCVDFRSFIIKTLNPHYFCIQICKYPYMVCLIVLASPFLS